LDWIDPTIVPFGSDDYRAYASSLPTTRLGKAFEAARCVAAKVQAEVPEPTSFDFIYVNALEFAVGLSGYTSNLSASVSHDTMDRLAYQLASAKSRTALGRRLRPSLKSLVTGHAYRQAFANVDLFNPWSEMWEVPVL
jgi:hypothetical protein